MSSPVDEPVATSPEATPKETTKETPKEEKEKEEDKGKEEKVKEEKGKKDEKETKKEAFFVPELTAKYTEARKPEETLVCVTGANGYIGSHIVEQLLKKGYKVRGTCRESSVKVTARVAHLKEWEKEYKGKFELLTANLNAENSFDAPTKGCHFVIHTASPYNLAVKEPDQQLLEPAVKGTLNVLKSCKKNGVLRVVVTSSINALFDEPDAEHTYTEKDWNDVSSLTLNPYSYSKVEAEKRAWNYASKEEIDLITINPALAIGPSHTDRLGESSKILTKILTKEFPLIVKISWAFVDVRDVARAHIGVLETPTASGRHLLAAVSLTMQELVTKLKAQFPSYPYPATDLSTSTVGTYLGKAATLFQTGQSGQLIRSNLGKVVKFDNSKSVKVFGDFKDFEATLRDSILDLIRWGYAADLGECKLTEEELKDLKKKMEDPQEGVGIKPRTFLRTTYPPCFVANRAITWVWKHFNLNHRSKAHRILEAMYVKGMFKNVTGKTAPFADAADWYEFVKEEPSLEELAESL